MDILIELVINFLKVVLQSLFFDEQGNPRSLRRASREAKGAAAPPPRRPHEEAAPLEEEEPPVPLPARPPRKVTAEAGPLQVTLHRSTGGGVRVSAAAEREPEPPLREDAQASSPR